MSSAAETTNTTEPAAQEFQGRNRISSHALNTLAQVSAGAQFGVQPKDVRVTFSDDEGALALSIATAVAHSGLSPSRLDVAAGPEQTLLERCINAKSVILNQVSHLAGVTVSRVDIRLTSVKFPSLSVGEPKDGSSTTGRVR